MNLNNKKFVVTSNESGLSSDETIFSYYEEEDVISGTYEGGEILEGTVVGRKISESELELRFQCLTVSGELKCGQSKGQISKDEQGRLRLHFDWEWLNGDCSSGQSAYVELL